MSSTSRAPRRHHHHQNFPPQQYADLRGSDITLLAPLFGPSPPNETDVRKKISDLISDLPSHLKSKISILSTFCSTHKGLNSLPISSILSFIQNEVTPEALFHWAPVERSSWLDKKTLFLLEEMNTIWQNATTFQAKYGRAPSPASRWTFVNHKCAACKLVEVSKNVPSMVALGAIVIARLDPVNWKRSKRIQWFEKWIAASVESEDQTESVVKTMWECGVKLRNAMPTSETQQSSKRSYIDDFVAQTKTPMRPARSEAQFDHVAFTERQTSEKDDEELSDTQSIRTIRQQDCSPPPPEATPSNETPKAPEKLPTRYVPSTDFFARVQQDFHDNDSKTLLRPDSRTPSAPRRPVSSVYSQPEGYRVASSIYSRATDEGDERWDSQEDWFRTSVLEESEFIDSYNRSSSGGNAASKPNEPYGFI